MKKLILSLALTAMICSTSYAQMGWQPGTDPEAEIQRLLDGMGDPMAEINALMREADNNVLQSQMALVQDYRQRTGDYQTPDQIVFQQEMNIYYAQNPGEFQRMMNDNIQTANNINRINRDTNEYIAGLRNETNRNRVESWDRGVQNFNRTVIREEGLFTNPMTGRVHELPNYAPGGVYRTHDGSTLIQDNNGTYHNYGSGGYYNGQLNDFDW